MAFLLPSTAQTRPLSTNNGQQTDNPQTPFSQKLQESSYIDDVCKGLDGEDCLVNRSLSAHTDYIYTQQNIVP
ncbi:hypothetical protein GQ457_03G011420 [Hibiscus cannabinus]